MVCHKMLVQMTPFLCRLCLSEALISPKNHCCTCVSISVKKGF